MAKKDSKPPVKARQLSIREFRSLVARAKKLGLVSSRVDARSQKKTRYMTGLLDKFKNVFRGSEKTVKVSTKDAKKLREQGAVVQNNRVVVPAMKGETPKYNKKTGELHSRVRIGSKIWNVYKISGKLTNERIRALSEKGFYFSVPFFRTRGDDMQRLTFEDPEKLIAMLDEYQDKDKNPYHGIRGQVELLTLIGDA